jgi:predicted aconitase with swiveling domain
MRGRVLVAGSGEGRVLRLEQDVSFWGAVDPASGRIIDRRHPQYGERLAGRVVLVPRSIGSSSGSAILLELLERGIGPAAIILGEPDQVLTLGAVVAAEMGYAEIPVLQLEPAAFEALQGTLAIDLRGNIREVPECC